MPIETYQATIYRTSDGQEFESQLKAETHQDLLDEMPQITDFIESLRLGHARSNTRILNLLVDYTKFKNRDVPDAA